MQETVKSQNTTCAFWIRLSGTSVNRIVVLWTTEL